jgi:hypothetical protein
MKRIAVAALLALQGCSGNQGGRPQKPPHPSSSSAIFRASPHVAMARRPQRGRRHQEIELPAQRTIHLALEAGGARFWEFTFRAQWPRRTRSQLERRAHDVGRRI